MPSTSSKAGDRDVNSSVPWFVSINFLAGSLRKIGVHYLKSGAIILIFIKILYIYIYADIII